MNNIKILVIENDDFVINDIRQMLKSCGFLPPRITSTGEEGLLLVDSYQPDIILMGLVLKGSLDGIEVFEKIKETTNIPVIFLTEQDEIDILKYVGVSETYGYLYKPFIERDLYANIQLALTVHQTEKRLKDSNEKFQLLSDSFPGAIYLRRPAADQPPLFLSNRFEAITGFSVEDLAAAGQSYQDMIHPEDLERVLAEIEEAIESHSAYRIHYRIRQEKDEWLAVEDIGNGVFEKDNLVVLEGFVHPQPKREGQETAAPSAAGSSHLLSLLDNCTEPMLVHNEGKIAFLNMAAVKLLGGHARKEFQDARILDFIHPEFQTSFTVQQYGSGELRERSRCHTSKIVRKDGQELDVEIAGTPLSFNGVPSIQLVIHDVSTAARVEKSRQVEQDRMQLIQKSIRFGHWEWDLESDGLTLSVEAAKMLGKSEPDSLTTFQDLRRMIHPEDLPMAEKVLKNCLDNGADYSLQYRIRTANDSIRSYAVAGNAIRDWQGRVVKLYGIIRDVTDQRKLEDKVKQYRERVDHDGADDRTTPDRLKKALFTETELLERGSVILIMAEPDDQNQLVTTYVSPNIVQLGEKGSALLSGEIGLIDLVHKDDRQRVQRTTEEALTGHRDYWEQEYRVYCGEDDVRWINESTQMQESETGAGRKTYFIFLSDITEIKQVRNELAEKHAQLIHSGRLASLGELAAGVAHELNQPLAIIQAQAELLKIMTRKQKGLDESLKEDFEVIIEEVDKAAEIIDHMREFARLDSRTNGAIRLKDPIEKSLMFFRKQFKNHDIELTTEFADDLPDLSIHPQRFEQIIINFMTNARYAVEKRAEMEPDYFKGRIQVKTFKDEDSGQIILEITDNGIGMTEEVVQQCLNPFFTTKDVGDGTGLGLSIVTGILKEFDGKLEIESEKGEGTTMRVLLPLNGSSLN